MSGFHGTLSMEILWVATWGFALLVSFFLLKRLVEIVPLGKDARDRLRHVMPVLGVILTFLFSLYSAESLFARFEEFKPIARLLVLVAFFVGARATVRDFFAGVFIRSENSIQEGDHVRIGELRGRMLGFAARGIQLETADGDTVLVPYARAASVEIARTQSAERGATYTFAVEVGEAGFSEMKARIERSALLHHFTSIGRPPEVVLQEGKAEVTLFVLAQEHAPAIKASILEDLKVRQSA